MWRCSIAPGSHALCWRLCPSGACITTARRMNFLWPPRLALLVLGLLGSAVGAPDRRWATSYDAPFSYQCPSGQALSHISSIHDNHKEDRIWDFRCQQLGSAGECRISAPANTWDSDMNFQCPSDEVISGMAGVDNALYNDRVFFFICCKAKVRLTGCTWTQDLNSFDGPLSYTLAAGQVFHGVHSRHSNPHEDRIWRFEVCNAARSG